MSHTIFYEDSENMQLAFGDFNFIHFYDFVMNLPEDNPFHKEPIVPGMVLTAYVINHEVHKVLERSKQAKIKIDFKKPLLFEENGEIKSQEFDIEKRINNDERHFLVKRKDDEILNITIKPNEYEHFEINEKNPYHITNDLNGFFYKEQLLKMHHGKYSQSFPGEESIFALGAGAEVFSYLLQNPEKQKRFSDVCKLVSEAVKVKEYESSLWTEDKILMPEKSVLMYDSIEAIINPIDHLELLRYELLDMNFKTKGKSGKGTLEFKTAAFYGNKPSALYSAKLRLLPLELLSKLKSF